MILRNSRNLFFLLNLIVILILIFYFNYLNQKERFRMETEIDVISKKLEMALNLNQKDLLNDKSENDNRDIDKETYREESKNEKRKVVINDSSKENFSEEREKILKNDFEIDSKNESKNEAEKHIERIDNLKVIEQQLESFFKIISLEPIGDRKSIPPETFYKLKELGIDRYYLSGVKLIDNSYIPMIHACLHRENYPSYIYHTWSSINYPEYTPEIALVKYLLLPEDNDNFKPNKSCYIKEIKSDSDWKEIQELYEFNKNLFN